jgi:hypothetical protein
MNSELTSNVLDADVEKYIESNIEKKINQLFDVLPNHFDRNGPKMIYEYTIAELYTGTIQTVVDILNDITSLNAERKYVSTNDYRNKLFIIFFRNDRKIFIGIVLVILSFILYFIDGADA